jgi:hypothetical protein
MPVYGIDFGPLVLQHLVLLIMGKKSELLSLIASVFFTYRCNFYIIL